MYPRRIFHVPDRRHLWDSSSSSSSNDDEEESQARTGTQSFVEVIDLSRSPEPIMCNAVSTTVMPSQSSPPTMASYVPCTLRAANSRRSTILPAFPTSLYNERPPLLLANVPVHKLDSEQRARRQQGAFPLLYTVKNENFDVPSYFRQHYQSFISSLIYQFNVDEAILDYNLYRFTECFRLFADDYIRRHKYTAEQFELSEKQKKYAFEFYLQMDVDLFFMKTCSFRQATPRSIDEGLFCLAEPDRRYSFSPCNNCPLCVPPYDLALRQERGAPLRSGAHASFLFHNDYQTILNCPADCHTRNLIYAMICPCGEFEYIGETTQRLVDRLWYHRKHLNRILHEFLIGEHNVRLSQTQEKDQETLVKDGMLLYRHAARCPSAMQLFLNFNPVYWCFVPVSISEAAQHNRTNVLPVSLVLLDSVIPTSIGSRNLHARAATATTRSDEAARSCMRNIPPVPPGCDYSMRQRAQQFQYFKHQLDVTRKQDETMDLFDVAVIAVLPTDAADAVRRFVEALFITHTEARLNTSGRLLHQGDADGDDSGNGSSYPMSLEARMLDREEWCRDLVCPSHQA